ncbi:MAG: hypothetical protein LBG13_02165 [Holosporales bacterium]|jgi:hypothetical protein|nr:hypothetical protein [Holosporales bacterium]
MAGFVFLGEMIMFRKGSLLMVLLGLTAFAVNAEDAGKGKAAKEAKGEAAADLDKEKDGEDGKKEEEATKEEEKTAKEDVETDEEDADTKKKKKKKENKDKDGDGEKPADGGAKDKK